MQNGMITTQLTPYNGSYFVTTSKILIPPSKSGKTRRRLARRLVRRQVCRLGGRIVHTAQQGEQFSLAHQKN